MTTYSDPNTTQREIVETSLATFVDFLEKLDATVSEVSAKRADTIDYVSGLICDQYSTILAGARLTLEAERVRLANIISTWDGTPLETVGAPVPYTS